MESWVSLDRKEGHTNQFKSPQSRESNRGSCGRKAEILPPLNVQEGKHYFDVALNPEKNNSWNNNFIHCALHELNPSTPYFPCLWPSINIKSWCMNRYSLFLIFYVAATAQNKSRYHILKENDTDTIQETGRDLPFTILCFWRHGPENNRVVTSFP